jgi:hypothetical protein
LLNCTVSHPDRSLPTSACTNRNDRYPATALNARDKNVSNREGVTQYGQIKERPGGLSQGEKKREGVAALLRCGSYFVKLGGGLFVLGENYVDLRVRGDRNDDAAVRIQIHHFGVARSADVFGQPLSQHVIF